MAFPPNYNQERSNRDKAKQAKAIDKQNKRDEKAAQRKHDEAANQQRSPSTEPDKDTA
jgi:hypothetical protein